MNKTQNTKQTSRLIRHMGWCVINDFFICFELLICYFVRMAEVLSPEQSKKLAALEETIASLRRRRHDDLAVYQRALKLSRSPEGKKQSKVSLKELDKKKEDILLLSDKIRKINYKIWSIKNHTKVKKYQTDRRAMINKLLAKEAD